MKFILSLFLTVFLVGCATSTPTISSKLSDPVFVQNRANSSVFVMFKNSATNEPVMSEILAEFVKNGFNVANDKDGADFMVLGDVVGFERIAVKDPNVFINMGVGSGFGRYTRSGGFFGLGMGFGLDDEYPRTNSYIYHLNATVLIRPKDGREQGTTITLTQNGGTYSPSYVWPHFKERLARQIVALFYQF